MITFQTDGVEMPDFDKEFEIRWINTIARQYGNRVGDISYIFCNDEKILEVNKRFLNHDYYTDIITFDYTSEGIINGDIFISLDTVFSNSEYLKEKYYTELRRVIIHGILHLCGVNDKGPGERAKMENAENFALQTRDALLQS